MQQTQADAKLAAVAQELAGFMLDDGGTLAQVYGLQDQELEAVYALGFNFYNQARWLDALKVFSFLVAHNHFERRYQVARAACLQMLKQYDEALKAYVIAHVMDITDPLVALHIAECLIAQGKREDALTALETVRAQTEDKPQFAELASRAAALAKLLSK